MCEPELHLMPFFQADSPDREHSRNVTAAGRGRGGGGLALLDRQPQGAPRQVHPPPGPGRQGQPQDGRGHHHLLQVRASPAPVPRPFGLHLASDRAGNPGGRDRHGPWAGIAILFEREPKTVGGRGAHMLE